MNNIFDTEDQLKNHTKKSVLKAIREKCLDCCGGQYAEVRRCHITDCALWSYRMGKNPFHQRKMTEEQKRAATQRLKVQSKKS